MKNQNFQSLNTLFDELFSLLQNKSQGQTPSLKLLFEEFLNYLMVKERENFLNNNPDNKSNGFYPRNLSLSFANLNLKVPRVRFGNSFRPALLPEPWKRVNKDYENLLLSFLTNGYKKEQIKNTLNLLNIPFSEDSLNTVIELIEEKLDAFRSQPLPKQMFAVFIDGYWAKMRINKSIKEITIFLAIGIDFDGYKRVLGYWICQGKENIEFWTDVLKNLISRGLSRVLLFITDDFSGLIDLIPKLFPFAHHQLCMTHFRRNLKKNLSKELYKKVKDLLWRLKGADNLKEGQQYLEQLVCLIKEEKPKLADKILKKKENYLAFLNYPKEIRKHIYTTNPVEGLNNGLELMRRELGGHFPSRQCLETNLFVQLANLADKWERKPVPKIRSNQPELRQLYVLRYGIEEVI